MHEQKEMTERLGLSEDRRQVVCRATGTRSARLDTTAALTQPAERDRDPRSVEPRGPRRARGGDWTFRYLEHNDGRRQVVCRVTGTRSARLDTTTAITCPTRIPWS